VQPSICRLWFRKDSLSLEGLCYNWGFYISCRGGSQIRAADSCDFGRGRHYQERQGGTSCLCDADMRSCLCSKAPSEETAIGTDAMVARRRWVLVQALPPSLRYPDDIFAVVLKSLRSADTEVMLSLADSMLYEITQIVGKENLPNETLFVVVDEVQVAAEYLKKSFRSFTQGLISALFCMRSTGFFGTLKSFGWSYLPEPVYR
jgi:hypothetical protein